MRRPTVDIPPTSSSSSSPSPQAPDRTTPTSNSTAASAGSSFPSPSAATATSAGPGPAASSGPRRRTSASFSTFPISARERGYVVVPGTSGLGAGLAGSVGSSSVFLSPTSPSPPSASTSNSYSNNYASPSWARTTARRAVSSLASTGTNKIPPSRHHPRKESLDLANAESGALLAHPDGLLGGSGHDDDRNGHGHGGGVESFQLGTIPGSPAARAQLGFFLSSTNNSSSSSPSESGSRILPASAIPGSSSIGRTRNMVVARGWGWKRLCLLAVGLLGIVWLLGPRDRRDGVVSYVGDKAGAVLDKAPWQNRPASVVPPLTSPSATGGGTPSLSPKPGPEGAVIDLTTTVRQKPVVHSDPLKTTRCESQMEGQYGIGPVDSKGVKRPLVQYALMIDAGSTGSRIHVYKFNFCKLTPELEDELFQQLVGGLSSFKEDAMGAANSLRPLLDTALRHVPASLHACTPVAVKATAGLRLLPGTQSAEILKAVRRMLETEYPFPIADGKDAQGGKAQKGVEIMDGKDEGVFAWITVNYLLNRIGSSDTVAANDDPSQQQTAAVMDLGGGSTQIVFEPIIKKGQNDAAMHPGEHVYELKDFGARSFTLYQNSYLGYGLMQARRSINALAAFTWSFAHPTLVRTGAAPVQWDDLTPENTEIPSPCFAQGRHKVVKIDQPGRKEVEVTFVGTGGGFDACRRLVEVMMDKDAVCADPPCSFAGVYQPSLMTTFARAPIVALSYFYDRLSPLGAGPTLTIGELGRLASDVCAGPSAWAHRFPISSHPEALAMLEDKPEACLDLTFMHGLLSLGYELDEQRQVTIAKKLAGTELGWCLGAQLAVLEEEGVLCKSGL